MVGFLFNISQVIFHGFARLLRVKIFYTFAFM
jgi:hypothetical protein